MTAIPSLANRQHVVSSLVGGLSVYHSAILTVDCVAVICVYVLPLVCTFCITASRSAGAKILRKLRHQPALVLKVLAFAFVARSSVNFVNNIVDVPMTQYLSTPY